MNSKMMYRLAVFIVCILLGLTVALLMKEHNTSRVTERNIQDLQNNIIDYQKKNEELSNRNIQLQSYIRELENDLAGQGNETFSRLLDERESFAIFAGLRPAENSGVIINLEMPVGHKMKDSVIRELVNELSTLGAQAISINGERKVATTEIRAKHDAILINGVGFDREHNFEIRAIMKKDDIETYVIPYLKTVFASIQDQLKDAPPTMSIRYDEAVSIPALREDRISYQTDLLTPVR